VGVKNDCLLLRQESKLTISENRGTGKNILYSPERKKLTKGWKNCIKLASIITQVLRTFSHEPMYDPHPEPGEFSLHYESVFLQDRFEYYP
jgi:hypothetical protein